MGFARILWQVEWRALVALAICGVAVGIFVLVQTSGGAAPFLRHHLELALISAAITVYLGFVPVVAFGAPIYAAWARRTRLPALSAVAIGVVPGLVLLWPGRGRELAPFAISCGAAVALITHVWFKRSYAPLTNRSTRTPHRRGFAAAAGRRLASFVRSQKDAVRDRMATANAGVIASTAGRRLVRFMGSSYTYTHSIGATSISNALVRLICAAIAAWCAIALYVELLARFTMVPVPAVLVALVAGLVFGLVLGLIFLTNSVRVAAYAGSLAVLFMLLVGQLSAWASSSIGLVAGFVIGAAACRRMTRRNPMTMARLVFYGLVAIGLVLGVGHLWLLAVIVVGSGMGGQHLDSGTWVLAACLTITLPAVLLAARNPVIGGWCLIIPSSLGVISYLTILIFLGRLDRFGLGDIIYTAFWFFIPQVLLGVAFLRIARRRASAAVPAEYGPGRA